MTKSQKNEFTKYHRENKKLWEKTTKSLEKSQEISLNHRRNIRKYQKESRNRKKKLRLFFWSCLPLDCPVTRDLFSVFKVSHLPTHTPR